MLTKGAEASRRHRAADPEKYREYMRNYRRSWREAHPEAREADAASARRYYAANSEKAKASHARWAAAHPDYFKRWNKEHPNSGKAWSIANAQHHRDLRRRWREANPEYGRQWRLDHPAEQAAYTQRHRALKQAAAGDASAVAIAARWAMWGGKCWMCPAPAVATDHVKPLSKGGSNWPANLRPICHSCNSSKHDRWPLAA